jgi:hypothetical protein
VSKPRRGSARTIALHWRTRVIHPVGLSSMLALIQTAAAVKGIFMGDACGARFFRLVLSVAKARNQWPSCVNATWSQPDSARQRTHGWLSVTGSNACSSRDVGRQGQPSLIILWIVAYPRRTFEVGWSCADLLFELVVTR